jgi:hypothetical protein
MLMELYGEFENLIIHGLVRDGEQVLRMSHLCLVDPHICLLSWHKLVDSIFFFYFVVSIFTRCCLQS